MRIALVHMRHAGTGGTERYLDLLARHLGQCGHEPVVVCRSHEAASHPAVRFELLRPFAVGGAWRMWSFARAVEKHVSQARYDLVVGLGKTWSHDVLRMGGGCHATYLERAHAATREPWERWLGKGRIKQRTALAIERRALADTAYERVITNSHMVKRDLMQRYDVPNGAIEVIYNGVDLERFHPRRRALEGLALRQSLGLEEDQLALLFLGSGYGRKGLDRLLSAFVPFTRQHPKAQLVVAGYDSARPAWERRAARLGLGARVHFLGGRRDAEACYAAADVYVLPTRYDPFANSTLEALAAGLPVITTDANGGSELIEEGVQGSVVACDPERDCTAGLGAALSHWAQPEARRSAAQAARSLAEAHGHEQAAHRTLELLESLRSSSAARSESALRQKPAEASRP